MNRKFFLFACMLIGAINLSCDDGSPIGSISPIVEAELPTFGNVGQEVDFMVSHAVFNGCGYYSSQETTQMGNTLIVTFYAQYHDGVCTMDIPIRKRAYTFMPTKAGLYTFMFNGGEAGYLIKTIQ